MAAINPQPSNQSTASGIKPLQQVKGINKLPIDILRLIYSFSGVKELQTLSVVSKYSKVITYKPKLWEEYAKLLNISIKDPANAKNEVLAYGPQLSKVNALLLSYFSAKSVHVQGNKLSKCNKSITNVFWDKIRDFIPWKKVDDPFELHFKIRRFIQDNIKTEKFHSILVPLTQKLYENIREKPQRPYDPEYHTEVLALQFLIDLGVPIKVITLKDCLLVPRIIYDLNYSSGFEQVVSFQLNIYLGWNSSSGSSNEEVQNRMVNDFISNCIRLSSIHFLQFLIHKFDVKRDRLLDLMLRLLAEWDPMGKSVSKADAILKFVLSKFKCENPHQLIERINKHAKFKLESLQIERRNSNNLKWQKHLDLEISNLKVKIAKITLLLSNQFSN